jgi:hypothetical protein
MMVEERAQPQISGESGPVQDVRVGEGGTEVRRRNPTHEVGGSGEECLGPPGEVGEKLPAVDGQAEVGDEPVGECVGPDATGLEVSDDGRAEPHRPDLLWRQPITEPTKKCGGASELDEDSAEIEENDPNRVGRSQEPTYRVMWYGVRASPRAEPADHHRRIDAMNGVLGRGGASTPPTDAALITP